MTRRLAIVALCALSGCGLNRPYPETAYYVLEVPEPPDAPQVADGARVIRVPRATVAPPFRSRVLQYRVAANQYAPDFYHNWADDPGALVSAAAAEALAATGVFMVVTPGSEAVAAETLELNVTELYVDVTGSTPTAVLAIQATLLDDGGTVLGSRLLKRTEPAASAEAPDAVRAFNTALQGLLIDEAERIARRSR